MHDRLTISFKVGRIEPFFVSDVLLTTVPLSDIKRISEDYVRIKHPEASFLWSEEKDKKRQVTKLWAEWFAIQRQPFDT